MKEIGSRWKKFYNVSKTSGHHISNYPELLFFPYKSKWLPFKETSFHICWLWSLFLFQLQDLPYKSSKQSSGCTEWFNILVAELAPEKIMNALNSKDTCKDKTENGD